MCVVHFDMYLKEILQHETPTKVIVLAQYAHDVVLTSIRRRFNVMDFVWTSKRRRMFTGKELLKVYEVIS